MRRNVMFCVAHKEQNKPLVSFRCSRAAGPLEGNETNRFSSGPVKSPARTEGFSSNNLSRDNGEIYFR